MYDIGPGAAANLGLSLISFKLTVLNLTPPVAVLANLAGAYCLGGRYYSFTCNK